MPARVIMPALELAQDSGKVLQWLRSPGDTVRKGDPLLEIETDKATVEIEAPASGVLREVTAQAGDVVPVGQTIALIFGADEVGVSPAAAPTTPAGTPPVTSPAPAAAAAVARPRISPLARKVAEQHGVDLAQVTATGGRIEKADVLSFVERRSATKAGNGPTPRLVPASPKARRLAAERGVEVADLRGSGPGGAVLTADVAAAGPGRVAAVAPAARRPTLRAWAPSGASWSSA